MGAHLRPWLLEFVREGLKDAAEWKSGAKENVIDWEDDRSNIRKKIVFNDTSDRFLQLVEVRLFARGLSPEPNSLLSIVHEHWVTSQMSNFRRENRDDCTNTG